MLPTVATGRVTSRDRWEDLSGCVRLWRVQRQGRSEIVIRVNPSTLDRFVDGTDRAVHKRDNGAVMIDEIVEEPSQVMWFVKKDSRLRSKYSRS